MCGRFSLQPGNEQELRERFGFEEFHERAVPPPAVLAPRWNIAPTQEILAVRERRDGQRVGASMRWGFQPAWMRESKRPAPINAQAETLHEKPLWRGALARGRCLIPADGFYEWAAVRGSRSKQPYYFRLGEGKLFAFAGLWTPGPDGVPTVAIATTEANELVAPIHGRMPAILLPEDEQLWLSGEDGEPAVVLSLLRPFPADLMDVQPVAPLVSNVHNDGPELVAPIADQAAGLFEQLRDPLV